MQVIQTEPTPNPNAVKFVISGSFPPGSHSFVTNKEAERDRIAKPIFALGHIASVFYTNNFLTVSKNPDGDWQRLKPAILTILSSL